MYKIIFAVLVLTMMFGCATRKTMTREEYLSTTQRTYANKTQTDVLNAAERVFILSDGEDYQFHHTDNTLSASRRWLVYLVFGAAMGTVYWTVQSTDVKGGTKASVLLTYHLFLSLTPNCHWEAFLFFQPEIFSPAE